MLRALTSQDRRRGSTESPTELSQLLAEKVLHRRSSGAVVEVEVSSVAAEAAEEEEEGLRRERRSRRQGAQRPVVVGMSGWRWQGVRRRGLGFGWGLSAIFGGFYVISQRESYGDGSSG